MKLEELSAKKICPSCKREVRLANMWATSDKEGKLCRMVCMDCWRKIMDKGYDDVNCKPEFAKMQEIKEKAGMLACVIENMRFRGTAGTDLAIDASDIDNFSAVPAAIPQWLEKDEKAKEELKSKVAEAAKKSVEAAQNDDLNGNLVGVGMAMGSVAVLREMGYKVDTIHYTYGYWRVPCIILVDGEPIYDAFEDQQREHEKQIGDVKELEEEEFEPEEELEFVPITKLRCRGIKELIEICEGKKWNGQGTDTEEMIQFCKKEDVSLRDVMEVAYDIQKRSECGTLEETVEAILRTLEAYTEDGRKEE